MRGRALREASDEVVGSKDVGPFNLAIEREVVVRRERGGERAAREKVGESGAVSGEAEVDELGVGLLDLARGGRGWEVREWREENIG